MEDPLAQILAGSARAGSNTVAVAGRRSGSGGAILANDPHLGLNLPNLWLVAGMRSPSFHAVGAMVPGLPIIGFGRNPDLAWGGTNMRAASSELFDVSRLPPEAFRADGRLRPAWDPNHPASQQAALLRRLAERERALQEGRSARADAEAEQAQAATASAGAPRAMPRHRLGLGELLDLEKNAGRPAGP
jgi:acyl-homoserine lactone acylase PvdQ